MALKMLHNRLTQLAFSQPINQILNLSYMYFYLAKILSKEVILLWVQKRSLVSYNDGLQSKCVLQNSHHVVSLEDSLSSILVIYTWPKLNESRK